MGTIKKSENGDSLDSSHDSLEAKAKAEPTKSSLRKGSTEYERKFERKFAAQSMKASLSTYNRTLVLGCAGVVGITSALFVVRFVLRGRTPTSVEHEYESGLE